MIRTYSGNDIGGVIGLWNDVLCEHSVDRRAFVKNVLLDMNFDPCGFVVSENDGIIDGFVHTVVRGYPVDAGAPCEEERGYINVIAVRDDGYETVGRELIACAERYIAEKGKRIVRVSDYSPNYFHPGICTRYGGLIGLFESCGYTGLHRLQSIGIDLHRYKVPDDITVLKRLRMSEGYDFTALRDELIPSLLTYASPGWTHRYRRLLNETFDYERFCLAVFDGEVIGCAVFGDPYSCDERFGPFSVNEKFRGLGLGKILLSDTLAAMKRKGLRHAWAQSTSTDGPAAKMYEKAGFYKTDEFVVMEKSL